MSLHRVCEDVVKPLNPYWLWLILLAFLAATWTELPL